MVKAIEQQLKETGQPVSRNPFVIAKTIMDSLAFRYASVLKTATELTGINLKNVIVGGGGGLNRYLNQMTANVSGLKVAAGLTEATVTGNLAVQAIASGRFRDLKDARSFVAKQIAMQHFEPKPVNATARERYSEIEKKYLES
jgi:rhamnulokinase